MLKKFLGKVLASSVVGVAVFGAIGCDLDEKKVGETEVAAGKGMQVGGAAVAIRSPHPVGKVAGAAVHGGGVLLEEDGKDRIKKVEQEASMNDR